MTFAARMTRSPDPFDPELGRDASTAFSDLAPELRGLIAGAAGCSPYLRGLIAKNPDFLRAAFSMGPEQAAEQVRADVAAVPAEKTAQALRVAKGQIALLTALADLGGVWVLKDVTGCLTRFADLAVERALSVSVAAEIRRGKLADIGQPSGGLVALAMGKMGAAELNYSSDIDLIVLFEESAYGDGLLEARPALVRATRRMAAMLSEITEFGYVFRTDLRLRPDAAVTPVALSMAAAEGYYESVGRTWERAAFIKARAAAGDVAAGDAFLQRLIPFVWRKHLDFAAIQDAHDMRLRIRAHKGLHGPITLPGHNMKLGRGGIREIEFFTQTRQLIAGGRDPGLRQHATVPGLTALADKGWVTQEAAETLVAAYEAHREVEHRLQMIADAQTHDLPGDDAGFDRLAAFLGVEAAHLRRDLVDRLEQVHTLTEGFFAPPDRTPAPALPDKTRALVEGWYSYPALRSHRAVEIFERLKPDLLARLAKATRPDEAVEHVDMFLAGLPAGVQLFSLFEANPQLIDLIVDIASSAPALARYLGRNAQVFDAVIGGSFFAPWPGMAALQAEFAAQLDRDPDYERQLDSVRRWRREWHFRIGVHFLRGLCDADAAGRAYADLAEAVLRALWPAVVAQFAAKHGPPPGQGAAVLGMGSLGAQQLSATSDLDLILVYDADGSDISEGRRPLAARQYYAKLTQAFITAVTAKTAEGALYEVDMRLRPSGRQGPVATSFQSFRDYQISEAWTWEHLALTRARFVAGAEPLGAAVEDFRQELLGAQSDPLKVCQDVAEMRERLHSAGAPDAWSVKRRPGGMQDIELLGQSAALIAGSGARRTEPQLQLCWLDPDDIATLTATHGWLWRFQAAARLLGGADFAFEALGEGGRIFLLGQTEAGSEAELVQMLADRLATAQGLVTKALAAPPGPR